MNVELIDSIYGFKQVKNPPIEEELTKYYQEKYYKSHTPVPQKKLANGDFKEIDWLSSTLWKDIRDVLTDAPNKQLLDYGTGTGIFAHYMQMYGWSVDQYDLGLEKPVGKYGAITLMHVIEHVLDPNRTLDELYSLLEDGGKLLVICPNDFSFLQKLVPKKLGQYWIAYPDHLSYFNKDALETLLTEHGFSNIQITTDFPMELFLLLGYNYVTGTDGPRCHSIRVWIETHLPTRLRKFIYRQLIKVGIGRNLIVVATK